MMWQPIESAPKDGTPVLVCSTEGIYQARFDIHGQEWDALMLREHGCGCCSTSSAPPEYWMRLPELPESWQEST